MWNIDFIFQNLPPSLNNYCKTVNNLDILLKVKKSFTKAYKLIGKRCKSNSTSDE